MLSVQVTLLSPRPLSPLSDAGLVVHIPGSPTRNVVCQCQTGTHCSGRECQSCQENKACGPGEGVEQAGVWGWE